MFRELFVNIELGPRAEDVMQIVEAWKPQIVVHEVAAEFAAGSVATAFGIPYADHSYGPFGAARCHPCCRRSRRSPLARDGLEPDTLGGLYRNLYLDVAPRASRLDMWSRQTYRN